jgi:hypothetical protein
MEDRRRPVINSVLVQECSVLKQILMRVIAGVLSGVLSILILAMLGVVTLI